MTMRWMVTAALCAGTAASAATPSTKAVERVAATTPFAVTPVATFEYPWAIAFLPDGRMLVTEKPGKLYLVSQRGAKQQVGGVPRVLYEGQGGLLDVAISPRFVNDHAVYLSYSEPGRGGSSLALTRATLAGNRLADPKVIWRQVPKGDGGQFGGTIAFDPAGQHLFLSSGERMRKTPAQDPAQALGKIIRLNLDGSVPADNPMGRAGGVRAQTWSTGHRNPYGLAFDAAGRLWEIEMGPKGGDELNLIRPGADYGWPTVSNGINYDGTPIPKHATRPQFAAPVLWWDPVIAPAGLVVHDGKNFPQWKGSAFTGGLASEALVRIAFDGTSAREAERWKLGRRVRDVVEGPDGALWLVEDEADGRLLKLSPKR